MNHVIETGPLQSLRIQEAPSEPTGETSETITMSVKYSPTDIGRRALIALTWVPQYKVCFPSYDAPPRSPLQLANPSVWWSWSFFGLCLLQSGSRLPQSWPLLQQIIIVLLSRLTGAHSSEQQSMAQTGSSASPSHTHRPYLISLQLAILLD